MKKTLLATTLATITLISASSAFAADTVDLNVGGTIAATACTPTLSGGGTIDFGDIKTDTLKQDDYTALPEKQIDITITCDGFTKIALHAINNRIGSMGAGGSGGDTTGNPVSKSPDKTTDVVGLGMDGNTKIGSYSLAMKNTYVSADGSSSNVLSFDQTPGATMGEWLYSPKQSLYKYGYPNSLVSWGPVKSPSSGFESKVKAVKTMSTTLSVQAYINKASALDLTKPIKLDGSTTLEVVYL
ncbi:Protein of uncharacterised function (DUF1120) [Serratia proteamaculans]|uniref:DUF1120 domain-containing protein n=1 Tax=Serratia proteamaculans TaxID=28151 RepID=UPI00217BF91B|nr:DUF1120 domain-containing protein [Serratia proteamaculans]CAI1794630.1 Protein of uncharacterised function (DUF1120) [Serratia proteamaculans]